VPVLPEDPPAVAGTARCSGTARSSTGRNEGYETAVQQTSARYLVPANLGRGGRGPGARRLRRRTPHLAASASVACGTPPLMTTESGKGGNAVGRISVYQRGRKWWYRIELERHPLTDERQYEYQGGFAAGEDALTAAIKARAEHQADRRVKPTRLRTARIG
jgi:hypothetical protein